MDTFLDMGLSNALVAGMLVLVIGIFGRVWRRPTLLHSLWLVVLLKLITPPLWPVPVTWPALWLSTNTEINKAVVPVEEPRASDPVNVIAVESPPAEKLVARCRPEE